MANPTGRPVRRPALYQHIILGPLSILVESDQPLPDHYADRLLALCNDWLNDAPRDILRIHATFEPEGGRA